MSITTKRKKKREGNEDDTIKLTQGGDFSQKFVIKRIGAGTAYRTLGVFIAANGSQKRQKEVLLEKSTTWSIKVSTSNLSQEEKLTSYRQQLLPSLRYPLPCTELTRKELRSVHYPSL